MARYLNYDGLLRFKKNCDKEYASKSVAAVSSVQFVSTDNIGSKSVAATVTITDHDFDLDDAYDTFNDETYYYCNGYYDFICKINSSLSSDVTATVVISIYARTDVYEDDEGNTINSYTTLTKSFTLTIPAGSTSASGSGTYTSYATSASDADNINVVSGTVSAYTVEHWVDTYEVTYADGSTSTFTFVGKS